VLLPLLPNDAYGYFAFNVFCVAGTLGTGVRVAGWAAVNHALAAPLHRLAKACMLISLVLAAWQGVDGDAWLRAFPAMFALGDGRGGGLRTEPSLLAPPLAMYLVLVFWRRVQEGLDIKERKKLLVEAGILGMATLFLTRSLSVAIVLVCFLPVFTVRLRVLVISGIGGALLAGTLFRGRIRDAISEGGTFGYFITRAVGSWRNVPDVLIFANARDYLLPGNPTELRDKLNMFATMWIPGLAWLDNTYSTFSASASTIGLIATALIFGAGLLIGFRRISSASAVRATWLLLYIADWFVLPKYEPSGWIGLGLLTAAAAANCRHSITAPTQMTLRKWEEKIYAPNC
jgi:hypothetical protein